MTQLIPLAAEPNQSFSVSLDDTRFEWRIRYAAGVMVADITVDDEVILLATRILAGEPIIPYHYLEAGNFVMLTDNGDLPHYAAFGVTQALVYLSAVEIALL